MALALGISFPILSWLGFVPGAHNSPAALTSLHLFFSIGPALGHSLSALLIWRFPLDEARHGEIAEALRLKKLAEARHGLLTGSWTGRSTALPFPRSPSELLPETVK
jgi:Na+/melibiose symporter-like transporter